MRKAIMFTSCGRRCRLLQCCKESLGESVRIVATDLNPTAPALYFADAAYVVPRIDDPDYIERMLDICRKENVGAITALIDPEIAILAANRARFEAEGVLVLAPGEATAQMAFDKARFASYLEEAGIRGIKTFSTYNECLDALEDGSVAFPLFAKPRTGSGSAGIRKINDRESLAYYFDQQGNDALVQECIIGEEVDVDVYVDPFSRKVVSFFAKDKLEMRPGGTSKSVSFLDEDLVSLTEGIVDKFELYGPTDLEFFRLASGEYVLIEINPRFSGAYLHAFGCGVDFFKLINKNIQGEENERDVNSYKEDVCMMLYDTMLIIDKKDLVG